MRKLFKYQDLYTASLYLYKSSVDIRWAPQKLTNVITRNKLLAVSDSYGWSPDDELRQKVYVNKLDPFCSPTLFVSPESKISRDILRAAGYKITYSREKADYIVIPEVTSMYEEHPSVVIKSGDNVLLVQVDNMMTYGSNDIDLDDIKRVDDTLKTNSLLKLFQTDDMEIIHRDASLRDLFVMLIPYNDDYMNLLSGMINRFNSFILDTNVITNVTGEVTVDNLNVMVKCPDSNILEKMVMQTNWQEYPFTLYKMLSANQNFSRPLSLAFSNVYNKIQDKARNEITPKDFEMYQSWMFNVLGVSEDGGITRTLAEYGGGIVDTNYLRRRMAVKPVRIERSMSQKELQSFIEKSR